MGAMTLYTRKKGNSMSGRKTSDKKSPAKIGESITRPLFLGVLLFVCWLLFFILTDIYLSNPSGFGTMEIRSLGVLRNRFMNADFRSYTFETGLGISIPRLLLGGSGGLLTFPASLLPVSIHPQTLAFLSALRLALGAAFFSYLLASFDFNNPKTVSVIGGTVYSIVLFVLSFVLKFPVADTFYLFPLVLILLRRPVRKKQTKISIPFMFWLCLLLISSAAWDLLVIPALAVICLIRFLKKSETAKQTTIQSVLSLGICAFFLLPQFLQVPCAIKGEPGSSMLQELGNDTDKYHTDVTYKSNATDLLLSAPHTLVIVAPQKAGSADASEATNIPVASDYPSIFSYFNEWFYSLWPSLPALPFQETSGTGPVFSDTKTADFTVTTLFSDPLYLAVKLPERSHDVDVYVNERHVSTISHSSGTVLVGLGSYNVGQTLTIRLRASHAGDLRNATASFGHMNTLNWSQYTENANYGITSKTEDADGITAEALVAYDATLLTNIPYEKGWTLYVNGEKKPVTAYRSAWVSSDLTAGSYLIHLHYTAPGSALGGWISGISFLILAALCILRDHSSSSSVAPETTSSSGASSKSL
jgi:uncharacterized membrane protein YfhO